MDRRTFLRQVGLIALTPTVAGVALEVAAEGETVEIQMDGVREPNVSDQAGDWYFVYNQADPNDWYLVNNKRS